MNEKVYGVILALIKRKNVIMASDKNHQYQYKGIYVYDSRTSTGDQTVVTPDGLAYHHIPCMLVRETTWLKNIISKVQNKSRILVIPI